MTTVSGTQPLMGTFPIQPEDTDIYCQMITPDGTVCNKKCTGDKRWRSMQEHIRRTHKEWYPGKQAATEKNVTDAYRSQRLFLESRKRLFPEGCRAPMPSAHPSTYTQSVPGPPTSVPVPQEPMSHSNVIDPAMYAANTLASLGASSDNGSTSSDLNSPICLSPNKRHRDLGHTTLPPISSLTSPSGITHKLPSPPSHRHSGVPDRLFRVHKARSAEPPVPNHKLDVLLNAALGTEYASAPQTPAIRYYKHGDPAASKHTLTPPRMPKPESPESYPSVEKDDKSLAFSSPSRPYVGPAAYYCHICYSRTPLRHGRVCHNCMSGYCKSCVHRMIETTRPKCPVCHQTNAQFKKFNLRLCQ